MLRFCVDSKYPNLTVKQIPKAVLSRGECPDGTFTPGTVLEALKAGGGDLEMDLCLENWQARVAE
jgi:hypothetical protein